MAKKSLLEDMKKAGIEPTGKKSLLQDIQAAGVKPTVAVNTEQQKPQGLLEKISNVAEKGLSAVSELTVAPLMRAGIRPAISLVRGIQGKNGGIETPWGKVDPYGEGVAQGKSVTGEAVGEALSVATAGLPIEKLLVAPLKGTAKWLYQSALKIPKSTLNQVLKSGETTLQAGKRLAETGLKERIWLTQGGAERAANKIDNLEGLLDDVIKKAGAEGNKISTYGLKKQIDETKKFFENAFDTDFAKKATAEIDNIYQGFKKKYGTFIPIEQAQKIKTATYSNLKKYFGELSGASQEAQKSGVRFLKEGIVKAAPETGGINKRLGALYDLDRALDSFTSRTKNLNLLGLPSKLGGAVSGLKGAVIGKGLELLEGPTLKSGTAILLNELTKAGGAGIKATKVPAINAVNYLLKKLREGK
jgi:hypothetical protein